MCIPLQGKMTKQILNCILYSELLKDRERQKSLHIYACLNMAITCRPLHNYTWTLDDFVTAGLVASANMIHDSSVEYAAADI